MHRPDEISFDPEDWTAFRNLGHAVFDDMVDYLASIRDRPPWQAIPETTRDYLANCPVPERGEPAGEVYAKVSEHVMPYPAGNIHPRFWSWVGGTGTPQGVIADLIASTMNSCVLGFDEAASTYVELQLLDWLKQLMGFPDSASGLTVSGGSMANLVGLAVARTAACDHDVRKLGVAAGPRLRFYASSETHSSVRKAIELLGHGSDSLVQIPVDPAFRIRVDILEQRIEADLAAGLRPAAIVGNCGTVNTGAVDPLQTLLEIRDRYELWLHIDGAFGALAYLSDKARPLVDGVQQADSLAFDLHKWMVQQYDVGCVLVRWDSDHRRSFQLTPAYLDKLSDGLASGPTDFSAYGVQLSRAFRAFRPWFNLRISGAARFRQLVDQNIAQARYLAELVDDHEQLERLAPTALNIVNFRFVVPNIPDPELDELNKAILTELHRRGIAAPSSTRIHGRFSIRVAIVNHRSRRDDFRTLAEAVVALGRELAPAAANCA